MTLNKVAPNLIIFEKKIISNLHAREVLKTENKGQVKPNRMLPKKYIEL